MYDCGVELTDDGEFSRPDYRKHACRGTYTLHSLYLLLWANFGSFCMALLTQPDAKERIHGHIISEKLPLRHYCVTQLKFLWSHIQTNLGLSEEQRSFFIMTAITKLHQVYYKSHAKLQGRRIPPPPGEEPGFGREGTNKYLATKNMPYTDCIATEK